MVDWMVKNYDVALQILGLVYVACGALYAVAYAVVSLTASEKDNIILEKIHAAALQVVAFAARFGLDIKGKAPTIK